MNELLGMDITQISYGALFVWLLYYVMKTNEKRESKYQDTIDSLSDKLNIVYNINEKIDRLEEKNE